MILSQNHCSAYSHYCRPKSLLFQASFLTGGIVLNKSEQQSSNSKITTLTNIPKETSLEAEWRDQPWTLSCWKPTPKERTNSLALPKNSKLFPDHSQDSPGSMDILTVQPHQGLDYHRAKDIPAKRHTKNSAPFCSADKTFISIENGRGTVIICDLPEPNALH